MNRTYAISPAVEALAFVLGGNTGLHILDYGDSETFSALWLKVLEGESPEITRQVIPWDDPHTRILIVGTAAPESIFNNAPACLKGVNSRDHLTALSWAAAWRLRHPDSPIRIAIVASETGDPTGNTPSSLATLFCARGRFGPPFIPRIAFLSRPDLGALLDWLWLEEEAGEPVVWPTLPLLRSCIWEGLTSTREQHHAFSNVLAASLLTAQVGGATTGQKCASIQDYLLRLVQSVGVDTGPLTGDQTGLQTKGLWIEPTLRDQIGGAVLLDDMADLWGDFLSGALGYSSEKTAFVTTPRGKFFDELGKLPDRLAAFLDSRRHGLASADIIPGQSRLAERFALFLDLRLFPDPESLPSGDTQEKIKGQFFRDLAAFGLKLLDSGRKLPWIDEAGRANLREELHRFLSDPSPLGVARSKTLPPEETLLARLLSLLDPTLPIIIFSSTHRSELIDPFRGYGNIITTLRKPILSEMSRDWNEVVKGLQADFISTMEQATRILRVRDTIRTFQQRICDAEKVKLPISQHGHLIEIFLDESEEPTQKRPPRAVCAGGIVVIRALGQNGEPVVPDAAVFESLAASRCLWGWCSETPTGFVRPQNAPQHRGYMPKGEDLNFVGNGEGPALLNAMVSSVRSALGEAGSVFPFAVICDRGNPVPEWMSIERGIDQWSVEKVLDTTLRRIVQHAVESLLFRSDVLRKALRNPKSRVAIDLAIRRYPCNPDWSFLEAFGIEVKNGKRPSFHSEDGFQLTSETIARTGIRWPLPSKIARARAVSLRDFGDNPRPLDEFLPKQLHYFADAVSHVLLYHPELLSVHADSGIGDLARALDDVAGGRQTPEDIIQFFTSGWIIDMRIDSEEEQRIEIGRLWNQHDRVSAIIRAGRLTATSPKNGAGIDLFRDLSDRVQHLSGAELSQLISRLSLPRGMN